jgi:hypothetical protein
LVIEKLWYDAAYSLLNQYISKGYLS